MYVSSCMCAVCLLRLAQWAPLYCCCSMLVSYFITLSPGSTGLSMHVLWVFPNAVCLCLSSVLHHVVSVGTTHTHPNHMTLTVLSLQACHAMTDMFRHTLYHCQLLSLSVEGLACRSFDCSVHRSHFSQASSWQSAPDVTVC